MLTHVGATRVGAAGGTSSTVNCHDDVVVRPCRSVTCAAAVKTTPDGSGPAGVHVTAPVLDVGLVTAEEPPSTFPCESVTVSVEALAGAVCRFSLYVATTAAGCFTRLSGAGVSVSSVGAVVSIVNCTCVVVTAVSPVVG